jgi:PAS domain S-box-containing protein
MPALPPIAELLADARLAALVAVPQQALLFDADGRLLFANPAGLKLTGATSLPDAEKLSPAELGPVAEAALELAPNLAAGTSRLQRLKLAGQPKTFVFSRFPLADGSEAILAAGLEAGREKAPALMSAVRALFGEHDLFALYDLDGRLIEASEAAKPALGETAQLQDLHPAAGIALDALREGNSEALSGSAHKIVLHRIGTKAHGAILALLADAEQPAAQPASETEAEATEPPLATSGALPARFVWRTDKDGVITSVSPELAAAVGAASADITGSDWQGAASKLGIVRADEVASAIARRDTWSGVTVLWPIAGHNETRPVDLAALPVFDRERRFQGYRGFGVFREPLAVPQPVQPEEVQEVLVFEERPENVVPLRASSTAPAATSPNGRELSASERSAFREIARSIGEQISEVNGHPRKHDGLPSTDTIETLPVSERALLDKVPVGVVVHRNERVLYANRTLLDWVGLPTAGALQQEGGLYRLFAGVPSIGASLPQEGHHEESHVLAISGKDGVPIPVEAKLVSLPWQGEVALAYVLTRAPGAPSSSEANALRLRDAEALSDELRGILDTATDGILLIDRDGRVLSLNRSAEALFGYDSEEIEGEPFTKLFAPESHRAAMEYLEGLSANNFASLLNDGREIIGRVREGGLIPVFMTLGRVGEGMQKFCAVFRDITQWKRAEEELLEAKRKAEQSSSAKSDFLAKISHEIRTPLNAIIGFADVMREERFGPVGNERYREYLKDIQTSGAHLVSLINDLLDLSKIEAGKVDLSFAGVDLNDIARQCMAIMQTQANRERIIIRTSLFPELPQVVADTRSIRQIALNLLSNSIKFTPPGGQVIVSTQLDENGEVLLRVRDTGVGMSEAEVAMAMEPFRQLSATASGSGLGLPLTKALTEANRARFTVKSGVNAGTLVEIAFPANRVLAN